VRPPRWSSLVFVAGVLLVFGALGWATFHALRLERLESEARALAHYQESIRLALWRMDSKITPIIAREAARPYFQYRPFYPANRAYTRMLNEVVPGEVMVPSPLLQTTDPFIKLHFERDSGGVLTSPQVPQGEMRRLAESVYVSGYAVVSSEQLLTQLDTLLAPPQRAEATAGDLASQDRPLANGPPAEAKADEAKQLEDIQARTEQTLSTNAPFSQPAPQTAYRQQQEQSLKEYQNRAATAANAQIAQPAPQYANKGSVPISGAPKPRDIAPTREAAVPPPPGAAVPAPAPASAPAKPAPADETRAASHKLEEKDTAPKPESDIQRGFGLSADVKGSDEAEKAKDPSWKTDLDKAAPEPPSLLVGPSEPAVVQTQFAPAWIPGRTAGEAQLVFTRDVDAGERHLTQGFWLDWPALQEMLLADAKDLLPGASLRPLLAAPDPADQAVLGRTLAAIPAELVAPQPTLAAMPVWSPVRSTLLATWIAALGAMIAIALVLRTSMELAERRGRFVSAVTHELRTPLTTFCLYSQMLADGMVKAEEDQRTYAKTLSSESQRLARIVESVLEYARLGRRHGNGRTRIGAAELTQRLAGVLRQRAEQAGMMLVVEDSSAPSAHVLVDPATIERVLYNLVDNACKYASGAEDKRIHFTVESTARDLIITVRDHGPGLERHEQRRIFRPFVRGHRQSDGSIPGLGLGLALSKGLARELHGELKALPTDQGAAFRLRIPLA
jgi:signal transduction histidine kinase